MVIDSAIPNSQSKICIIQTTLITIPIIENKENKAIYTFYVATNKTINPKTKDINIPYTALLTNALSVIIQVQ